MAFQLRLAVPEESCHVIIGRKSTGTRRTPFEMRLDSDTIHQA